MAWTLRSVLPAVENRRLPDIARRRRGVGAAKADCGEGGAAIAAVREPRDALLRLRSLCPQAMHFTIIGEKAEDLEANCSARGTGGA